MSSNDGVRLNVLGSVQLLVDGRPVELANNPVLAPLLTLLALGPDNGIPAAALAAEIWQDRESKNKMGSLHQAIRRLRRMGLESCLPKQSDARYRLALSPDRVDARRMIAAAATLRAGGTIDDDALAEVLGLWRGDPTADQQVRDGAGDRVRAAHRLLVAEQARRKKPRILILDDKVGDKIRSVLGDYPCRVITRIDDFWDLDKDCEGLFDVALIDLHLSDGDCGAEGLAVLDALMRSSVPAVLMTYRPQPGWLEKVVQRYNLLAFYVKPSNTPDGDFTPLRDLVAELVGGDAEQVLLPRLDEELARRERKAQKAIELTGRGDVAREAMLDHVDRIRGMIRRGSPLAVARRAMADFNDQWLVGER